MKKRILFIEDERALQESLKEVLKNENYEIISVFDGQEALEKLKEDKFDLIILDLILPKLHGFDLLKIIKETPEVKETPLIILSNLESPDDIGRALELGVTTYLAKSNYTLAEIVNKIKEILE